MEVNKNIEVQTKRSDKGYTYVFDIKEDMTQKSSGRLRRKLWQIVPSVCASTMCVPFGIMLGWPSPTYPTLLEPTSPVFINLDQSAMVAGFLMIGNTVATPFSSHRRFDAKYGVIFGASFMTLGWLLMWQARDIYWLLASRFLVGAGTGYGVGQLKNYVKEMCDDALAQFAIKQINLYVFFGVILAFGVGPFVDFRQFGIIAVIVTIFTLFLSIFLPSTPRELLKNGQEADAQKLIKFLSPDTNVVTEMHKIRVQLDAQDLDLTLSGLLKDQILRKNFVVFALLVFFQQFSGVAATIVYSQILFTESHCPYPEFCALVYSIVFFLSNIFGIFFSTTYNKKTMLLFSSIGVSMVLAAKILTLTFEVNDKYWNLTSFVVMLIYAVLHSVGLGNVPFTLIGDYFPTNGTKVVVHFFVMFHSMLALIITKIFQTMFDRLCLYTPFCLFLAISLSSSAFIAIFVSRDMKLVK